MNKKLNKTLNIIELILLIVICTIITVSSVLHLNNISLSIINYVSIIIGLLSEITIISIELFLFIILKKKYKMYYLTYLFIDLLLFILATKLIPFGGIISILPLCTIKSVFRISNVKVIYEKKYINRYFKMFNITLPKETKKKVAKRSSVKQTSKRVNRTQKSYA